MARKSRLNRIVEAVKKKRGVIIHDRCQGYGCDECCGVGAWDESLDKLIRGMGAWCQKAVADHWRREQEWDRIQRMLNLRIDAMNARLEAACDYLHVPYADEKRPKTILP